MKGAWLCVAVVAHLLEYREAEHRVCFELRGVLHAVGGVADHIEIVPSRAVAEDILFQECVGCEAGDVAELGADGIDGLVGEGGGV